MLPPIILGGAGGFSYQTHPDPFSIPIDDIVKQAFDHGVRAIDTSPFYEPSEDLFGKALTSPKVTEQYSRSDYVLMTKVGRIAAEHFDYTPGWIRKSVLRSLKRLKTPYLDVVFCHDIESVTDQDTMDAIGVLIDFVCCGQIKYIGLSSYRMDILAHRARLAREIYGRPIDVVQTWAQLTIQNSRLETHGLEELEAAGVSCVCASSPLAIGLLRRAGVPIGKFGDAHPAPSGLRQASFEAAEWVESQGDTLEALSLRYALWRARQISRTSISVKTITGISSLSEINQNVETARTLFHRGLSSSDIDQQLIDRDASLVEGARSVLGNWVNWSFTCPPEGWSQSLKRMVIKENKTQ